MSYVRLWIHCVWGTKNRVAFITEENKNIIIEHIRENATEKAIHIDFINGHKEHFHCLISLNKEHSISEVMHLIKGESSHWINKNEITNSKFEWADEYFAASISESHIDKVRDYIKSQKKHHQKKSWNDECKEFLDRYGFEKFQG